MGYLAPAVESRLSGFPKLAEPIGAHIVSSDFYCERRRPAAAAMIAQRVGMGLGRVSIKALSNARISLGQACLAQAIHEAFRGGLIVDQQYPGNMTNSHVRGELANL